MQVGKLQAALVHLPLQRVQLPSQLPIGGW